MSQFTASTSAVTALSNNSSIFRQAQATRLEKVVQIRKAKRSTVLAKKRFQSSSGSTSNAPSAPTTTSNGQVEEEFLSGLLSTGITSKDKDEHYRSLVAIRATLEKVLQVNVHQEDNKENSNTTDVAERFNRLVSSIALQGGFSHIVSGLACHGRTDIQAASAAVLALLVSEDTAGAEASSSDGRAVALLGSHPHCVHETVSLLLGLLTMRAPELPESIISLTNSSSAEERQLAAQQEQARRFFRAEQLLDVRECAAWCLGNLVADSSELRGAIISAGAIPALVDTVRRASAASLMTDSSSSSSSFSVETTKTATSAIPNASQASYRSQALIRQTVFALAGLCRGANVAAEVAKNAVFHLSQTLNEFLMTHESVRRDPEAAVDICYGLYFLSRQSDEETIQAMITHGVLSSKSLAKLLLDPPHGISKSSAAQQQQQQPSVTDANGSLSSPVSKMAMSGGSVSEFCGDNSEEESKGGDDNSRPASAISCHVSSDEITTAALKVLGNIAAGSDEQTILVATSAARAEVGWLRKLAPLLQRGSNDATSSQTKELVGGGVLARAIESQRALKREVCWLVANLAATGKSALLLVAKPHGPSLIAALSGALSEATAPWSVRRECLFAVSNLVQTLGKIANGADAQSSQPYSVAAIDAAVGAVQLLLDYGALPPLVAMLEKSDVQVVATTMQAMATLLALAESNADASHGQTASVRSRCGYFKDLVKEASGEDMLNLLQEHPNEQIYNAAANLKDRYFSCESDDES